MHPRLQKINYQIGNSNSNKLHHQNLKLKITKGKTPKLSLKTHHNPIKEMLIHILIQSQIPHFQF